MALYKHCRFDTDYEGLPDESDDFVEFRHNVSDTIKDVVFIIGSDHCVEMVHLFIYSFPWFNVCTKHRGSKNYPEYYS